MNVPRGFASLLLVTALVVETGFGEEWKSPDGMVGVTAPNADHFLRMDDPPTPFLVLWISMDKTWYFGVRKTEVPKTFSRSAAEAALAEETKGAISDSSTVVKNGQEIWVITADAVGHGFGASLQVTQAITQVGSNVYEAYVGAVDAESEDRAAADAFLSSFEIKQTDPAAEPAPPSESITAPVPDAEPESAPEPPAASSTDAQVDRFNLWEWIVGLGVLAIVVLVLWSLAGRGGKAT